jgi:hypothetical protein
MNTGFELLQAEVSGRTKRKVEMGSMKAIDVVKGSLEMRPLKVVSRAIA